MTIRADESFIGHCANKTESECLKAKDCEECMGAIEKSCETCIHNSETADECQQTEYDTDSCGNFKEG
jgi:hypothetical protein